jgi:hypothetical protein
MSDLGQGSAAPAGKPRSSPRAAASIVFACVSLYLWRIYGEVHWAAQSRMGINLQERLSLTEKELMLGYFMLAGLAAIWCLWSWLKESRLAAAIATLFTLIAVAVVTTMQTYSSP